MNSFYIQYFVVSPKDISESMDFSDIQSKFWKKKKKIVFFLICFEGASYMLTQLWFVCCSHTLTEFWTPHPQPFLLYIFKDFSSISF